MLASFALNIPFHPPTDFGSNYEIVLRWIHFASAITWIGLLYFFNLVNMPLQKQMDAPTKAKVNPPLLSLALWWFRWGAVVTVLAGIVFWSRITVVDARNHGYSARASSEVSSWCGRSPLSSSKVCSWRAKVHSIKERF